MPLTEFQCAILSVISSNRSEESHFAGGIVLNYGSESPRYSRDFDIFHDAEEEIARASDQDVAALKAAGYEVHSTRGDWSNPCSFRQAYVEHNKERLEIDWALDSAFRFFPIEKDPELGFRLHLFDAATNKALALGSRSETRDYVDIVALRDVFPFAAILWAACGKDPGFTPLALLNMMRRFARVDPRQLKTLQAENLDPIQLKSNWVEMSDRAEEQITQLAIAQPDVPIGVAFVDHHGSPGWLGDNSELAIHYPSVRGCWPKIRKGQ